MNIDLTSGEVNFELINDFRGLVAPVAPIPDYSTDYSTDYYI